MSALNKLGYFAGAVAATMVGWFIVQRTERLGIFEREAWANRLTEQLDALPTYEVAAEECCGLCTRGCWNG